MGFLEYNQSPHVAVTDIQLSHNYLNQINTIMQRMRCSGAVRVWLNVESDLCQKH